MFLVVLRVRNFSFAVNAPYHRTQHEQPPTIASLVALCSTAPAPPVPFSIKDASIFSLYESLGGLHHVIICGSDFEEAPT